MTPLRRLQLAYYATLSLYWIGSVLPAAVLMLFMQARGLDLFQIGMVIGLATLLIALLEVPTGGLADRIGRKRTTLIAYVVKLLSTLVLLFAFSYPAFLLWSILSGVSWALASGALEAWFIDELYVLDPDMDIHPPLAISNTVTSLALAVGTLAGGALPAVFAFLPAEGSGVLTPYATTVVASAALLLAAIFGAALLVREERKPEWSESSAAMMMLPTSLRQALRQSLAQPALLLLFGATFASGMFLRGVETFWQPFFAGILGDQAQESVWLGVLLAGTFGMSMIGSLVSVPISRLLGRRYARVAAIFQGLQGVTLILLALQASVFVAAAFFWLTYLMEGVVSAPHKTLFNRMIPSSRRSTMLSVHSLVNFTGGFIGSAGLGFVAVRSSVSTAWLAVGAVVIASLTFYLALDRYHLEKDEVGHAK